MKMAISCNGSRSLYIFMALISFFMSGCSMMSTTTPPSFYIDDDLSRNTLLAQLRCDNYIGNETADITPPTLYKNMQTCIKKGNNHSATLLFSLAGAYTWYDASRVNTNYARKLHSTLLSQALKGVDSKKKNVFWLFTQDVFSDSQQHAAICKQINKIGAPTYNPLYMEQDSSQPRFGIAGPVTWDKALKKYLHCG